MLDNFLTIAKLETLICGNCSVPRDMLVLDSVHIVPVKGSLVSSIKFEDDIFEGIKCFSYYLIDSF